MPPGESSAIIWSGLAAGFGALLCYVASRGLAEPAGARGGGVSPARAAIGHWLVILAVVFVALVAGHSSLAIGVVFSTSVAALSMALGLILALTQRSENAQPARSGHGAAAWRMLVPASLIPLLGGFSGRVTAVHAAALLAVGVLAAMLWRDDRVTVRGRQMSAPRWPWTAPIQMGLGLVLAAVAAVLVFRGVWGINQLIGVPESGIAPALLGPVLVLPMIASATQAGAGHRRELVARCSAVALLNLCLLLPLVVALSAGREAILSSYSFASAPISRASHWLNQPAWSGAPVLVSPSPTTAPTTKATTAPASHTTFAVAESGVALPLVIWRVDCPCLVVLALVLVPISLGRWELEGLESILLAGFYFLYVMASAAVAIR